MNERLFHYLKTKPEPYESGEKLFWDDDHISQGMLEAHLDQEFEGATRNFVFVFRSVKWIASLLTQTNPKLIDLGCGPGIYAQQFHLNGFKVTGIDFSRRSIQYAKDEAQRQGFSIEYRYMNYLTLDYEEEFDVATLIYCDYGVLPPNDRRELLKRVRKALKPGGLFIFDAFTPVNYENFKEERKTAYRDEGFWTASPHVLIQSNVRYETDTFLEQYLVLTEHELKRYNIWNQAFTQESLAQELVDAGFRGLEVYANVAGDPFTSQSDTICFVAHK